MTTPQIKTFKPSDTICSKVNVRPASKAKNIDELVSDIAHHGAITTCDYSHRGWQTCGDRGATQTQGFVKARTSE